MLEELSQEVDASVHVNRTNEGNQLKEEETGLKGEEEGASTEDLG